MTRLINADELSKKALSRVDELSKNLDKSNYEEAQRLLLFNYIINKTPEVEAIPIEWIKNRIKEIKHAHEICGVNNNDAITILESMLYEWDKQNRGEE